MEKPNFLNFVSHGDDHFASTQEFTDSYLERNAQQARSIENSFWIVQSLVQLIPVTKDNLFSGNLFPISEAKYELMTSVSLARMGLYKHALIALRQFLELGFLSVSWDSNDLSHQDIQPWLASEIRTPGWEPLVKRLKTIDGVSLYLDSDPEFFDRAKQVFHELGAYVHTRGYKSSSSALYGTANFPIFNEATFELWSSKLREVVRAVLAVHLMKYPVGMLETPLSNKYGLNSIAGGLVEPHQAQRFAAYLDEDVRDRLRAQSEQDEDAVALQASILNLPDLTPDEWEVQLREHDEWFIEMSGYEEWLRMDESADGYRSTSDLRSKHAYRAELRGWAEERGLLTAEEALARGRERVSNGEEAT